MADETVSENKVASRGRVQQADIPMDAIVNPNSVAPEAKAVESGIDPEFVEKNVDKDLIDTTEKKKNPLTEISDDQLKAYFEKQGIEYAGIDDLKKKLSPKEAKEESAEQKAEKEKAFEKRMLNVFTEGAGTVDQYAAIKSLANADLKELSNNELRRELKEAGFSEAEQDTMIKEMSMQIADDELDQYEDETEKEFLKRKRDFGSKLMESRFANIKQSAAKVLSDLKAAVDAEDAAKQQEEALASKIDDHFSKLPRTITFELGTENNRKIDPIDYEVSEKDLTEIRETLKDPAQRNNFLFNDEGDLNLDNLATVMLNNKLLKSALKTAYLTGETKSTEHFQNTFGARTPYAVGVGGVQNKPYEKGVATQVGKPQRVMPSQT